jgi:hypothetical protein
VRIDVIRQEALNRAGEPPIEAMEESGFKYGSFKENVGLAGGRRSNSRRGSRTLGLLLSVVVWGSLRSKSRCWRRPRFQQFGELRCARVRMEPRYCRVFLTLRSRLFSVGESHIRSEKREIGPLLAFGFERILLPL